MNLSLGEAARVAGVSKSTINRAISRGRLSANRKDDGSYEIDPAELCRVYPPPPANGNGSTQPGMTHHATQDLPSGTGVLTREVELLRERLADKDSVIDDLRRRLDTEAEERRRLTALLTDQRATRTADQEPAAPAQAAERPKGWRGFLLRLAG